MSDLGDGIAAAIGFELAMIVLGAALFFGGIGWAIGHFLL